MPYASRLFNNEYIEMKIGKFLWELPFFYGEVVIFMS